MMSAGSSSRALRKPCRAIRRGGDRESLPTLRRFIVSMSTTSASSSTIRIRLVRRGTHELDHLRSRGPRQSEIGVSIREFMRQH